MIVAELDQRAYSFRINIVGSYYGRQRMLARLGTYELENLDLAIHSSPVAHHLLPLHECFYVDEMHALNKLVTAGGSVHKDNMWPKRPGLQAATRHQSIVSTHAIT